MHPIARVVAALAGVALLRLPAMAQNRVRFDFTAGGATGWIAAHDVGRLQPTSEGLRIQIAGDDPYIVGPPTDYPAGQPLWLSIRLKSDEPGAAQVFYFTRAANEEHCVRMPVPAGRWYETTVAIPPLGPGYRLRIDPPGDRGSVTIAAITLKPRRLPIAPAWPKPTPVSIPASAPTVRSGPLTLAHASHAIGAFKVTVSGADMARGNNRPMLGYLEADATRWLDLARGKTHARMAGKALEVTTLAKDPGGAVWQISQRFTPRPPQSGRGAIEVETRVSVNRARFVAYLPVATLFPGLGSYGAAKTQAVLPGVEYLDRPDASSSEADLKGPAARRLVPDTEKITFPLMALCARHRFVALEWTPHHDLASVFDSPDRTLGSAAHMMGLLFPGSHGADRDEGSLLPYGAETIRPGVPLVARYAILGGPGESIVPAVQQYVARHPLPPVPDTGRTPADYAEFASHGWLDSAIREGDLYRHAATPGFTSHPSADAAAQMLWLARQLPPGALTSRLEEAARDAVGAAEPADYNDAIGHVGFPTPALVFGHVEETVRRARQQAHDLLGQFEPDGTIAYRPEPGRPDYGSTHFEKHANGLTAQVVLTQLEAAVYGGDHKAVTAGLRNLDALGRYLHTAPRGSQTWEIPLHTPDILASAELVRAYSLGYELTGRASYLNAARYWAWTGVPFLYLVPPSDGKVGIYGTIAVLGATAWVAPVWIGLPVQWCGMVYADALYRFAPLDPSGPWMRLADGITASGVQQSYPESDQQYQGLLPDSFQPKLQIRNGPAITPATVQSGAARLYRLPAFYDRQVLRSRGWYVHAPGKLSRVADSAASVQFTVHPWPKDPCWVLVSGLSARPDATVNGRAAPESADAHFDAELGTLTLRVQGVATVELRPHSGN